MSNIYNTSTLEYYNYGENNRMDSKYSSSSYRVKVSDKDGNIITIEKDDALYAMVSLSFDPASGVLKLLDVAHDNSILAEIEMPNADFIYNCRFDEESDAILFDVKSLYGDRTDTIELNVESLIEIYEAGQGIEIGNKNEETGRKPISIKLVEGENLLQLSDEGLGIDGTKVISNDELNAAISGKADISFVYELYTGISGMTSGVTDIYEAINDHEARINKLNRIVGTEEEVPSLYQQLVIHGQDISDIDTDLAEANRNIDIINDAIDGINDSISSINGNITLISDAVETNKVHVELVTDGLEDNVREAYVVKNTVGEQLGDMIKIYRDASLLDVEYATVDDHGVEGKYLKITYLAEDGTTTSQYIDLSALVIDAQYADGLESVGSVVKVKVDSESDDYLTVSEDGVKISGVASAIDELTNANVQLATTVRNNKAELEGADSQLWNAISNEGDERRSTYNSLKNDIDVETEHRTNEVSRLDAAISNESVARVSGDTVLTSYVNEKVLEEKTRAEVQEATLSGSVSTEIARAIGRETDISNNLTAETAERRSEDANIRQLLYDNVQAINGNMGAIQQGLATEAVARQAVESHVNDVEYSVTNYYAPKTYVDEKANSAKEAAYVRSTGYTNDYVDNSIDGLEASMKHYCDSGHTELQREIDKSSTKINVISNLIGVNGADASNYEDSGNGILDVLHKEYHQLINGVSTNQLNGLLKNILDRLEALENG